jgi:hypothetical protein
VGGADLREELGRVVQRVPDEQVDLQRSHLVERDPLRLVGVRDAARHGAQDLDDRLPGRGERVEHLEVVGLDAAAVLLDVAVAVAAVDDAVDDQLALAEVLRQLPDEVDVVLVGVREDHRAERRRRGVHLPQAPRDVVLRRFGGVDRVLGAAEVDEDRGVGLVRVRPEDLDELPGALADGEHGEAHARHQAPL